jgi:hypothetical protein
MSSVDDLFTTLGPDDLWKIYADVSGIFRGGGNSTDPKLLGPKGPRSRDFTIVFDPTQGLEIVLPDPTKGLSFSNSIERLQGLRIKGIVWRLPKGALLPRGLVFNCRDRTHPLLNVSVPTSVIELTAKLTVLSRQLVSTRVEIR